MNRLSAHAPFPTRLAGFLAILAVLAFVLPTGASPGLAAGATPDAAVHTAHTGHAMAEQVPDAPGPCDHCPADCTMTTGCGIAADVIIDDDAAPALFAPLTASGQPGPTPHSHVDLAETPPPKERSSRR